jgi:hypothetical protein
MRMMPPAQSSVLKAKRKYGPAAEAQAWGLGRGLESVSALGSELESVSESELESESVSALELGSGSELELESALAWEQELGQGPQSER